MPAMTLTPGALILSVVPKLRSAVPEAGTQADTDSTSVEAGGFAELLDRQLEQIVADECGKAAAPRDLVVADATTDTAADFDAAATSTAPADTTALMLLVIGAPITPQPPARVAPTMPEDLPRAGNTTATTGVPVDVSTDLAASSPPSTAEPGRANFAALLTNVERPLPPVPERLGHASTSANGEPPVNALQHVWSPSQLGHGAVAEGAAPPLPVTTPAHQPGWAEDVGNRIGWMIGQDMSRAELVLTPPHLGRVEVTLDVNGSQASAWFVSPSAETRDALEQALPRLREALEGAGIQLGQAQVSSGQSNAGENGFKAPHRGRSDGPEATAAIGSAWTRGGSGLIDTFA